MKQFIKDLIYFLKAKSGKRGRIHEIQFEGWMIGYNAGLDVHLPKNRRS